jgi:ATP-dependent helicase HrpA
MHTRAPFWRHNRDLIADLRALEAKTRRRDILVDEEVIFAFYAKRVPDGIYSVPQLESWLRGLPRAARKCLHMRLDDIARGRLDDDTPERFPDALDLNGSRLPLAYRFVPGESDDGVTVSVPVAVIGQITPGIADRLVPGLLREKLSVLIKSLPKQLRRQLVPIPDTVERCLENLPVSDTPLVQTLGQLLKEQFGVSVPETAWRTDDLPEHLRLRVRLLDAEGRKTLGVSRDVTALQREFGGQAVGNTAPGGDRSARMVAWDCGRIPAETQTVAGQLRMRVYPALVDRGDHVVVRDLDSLPSAQATHRAGVRRLLMLVEAKSVRNLRKNIKGLQQMQLHYAKVPAPPWAEAGDDPVDLSAQLLELAFDRAFLADAWSIRDAAAFEQTRSAGRARVGPALLELGELVAGVLERAHRARSALAVMQQPAWRPSVEDMQGQLDGLVHQGFLHETGPDQLEQLPRYLDALLRRIDQLPVDARRDQARLSELRGLRDQWQDRYRAIRRLGGTDVRLEEIRWLLEELRVSLFAQALRTRQPVSVKRIQRRWAELGL